jgi:mRNA-degrading endonuclease RelE of RelBE toxin-antitoxin system
MKWNLTIAGPAQKDFQKLPRKDQARVKTVLISM